MRTFSANGVGEKHENGGDDDTGGRPDEGARKEDDDARGPEMKQEV